MPICDPYGYAEVQWSRFGPEPERLLRRQRSLCAELAQLARAAQPDAAL